MRAFFLALLLVIAVPVTYAFKMSHAHADLRKLPELESGDLIFDTTVTHQTPATIFATHSLYTHVGVVHKIGDSYSVIQAARTVVESPLSEFIHGAWGERFTVMRYTGLTDAQREEIVNNAKEYLGRNYNYIFYMPSEDIYCSEIPYFAFDKAHVPIGALQKVSELHVDNPAVKQLFKERWQLHPACKDEGMDYEACWQTMLKEPIITPVSLARDPHLTPIYTNYLF